jgi:zinc protease
VNNMTLEDCKAYYNTYFKPNTAYLVVVGDINLAEAKKLVNQAFGTWAKGDVPTAEYPIKDAPSKNHVAFVNKTGAVQSVVQITFPFDLTPGHEDEIKVRVMNNILGGGVFLGRLMQNLREEHAYTYGARSSLNSDKLRGSFTAYASVRNDVTDSSVVEFLYELDRMVNEDVSAEDLQMVKNSLSGSFGRSLESPQTVARFALNMDRYKLPADYYKEYLTQVESVTIEDVREMARKYLRPEAANILVVGNQMEVAEKLARFDANGKVNHYDLEGNTISGILRKDAPEGVTPQTIADNYILAITNSSDMKKAMKILKKVKDIKQVGEVAVAGMDGMSLDFTVYKKAPNKYSMSIMFNGMVAQKQVFDGTKGKSVNMQTGSKDLAGEELETVKASAVMFGERNFATSENTMEVVGVETVEGADCYVLDITNKAGSTSSHYYDAKTGLKVQTVSTQEVPGAGEVTQITKLSDYKTVNKVKFPHLMSIDGPQKISMKTTALEVNSKVSDAVFQ